MCKIGKSELRLDGGDLLDGVIKAIVAELLAFDFLELLAHLLVLFFADVLVPGREDDGIFAGSVLLVHQRERIECGWKLVARGNPLSA